MCGWLDVREVQLVGTEMREDKKLGTIAIAISKVSPEWIGASRPLPPSWRAR